MQIKQLALTATLGVALIPAHANSCEQLEVSIYNKSGHICQLQKKQVVSGTLFSGEVSSIIPNGEMTPSFMVQQAFPWGVNVNLEYRCGNKAVKLSSMQNFCFLLLPGIVEGYAASTENASVSYTSKYGNWFNSTPGRISWVIS